MIKAVATTSHFRNLGRKRDQMNLTARNQTDGDQTAAFFSKKTAKKLKCKE